MSGTQRASARARLDDELTARSTIRPRTLVLPDVPRHRLLVVDDEPLVRAFARKTLEKNGYQVLEAGSIGEALAILRRAESQVELVLTDVGLPDGLGPELVGRVASSMPWLATLLMSGDSRDHLVRTGRVASGVRVLEKPFRVGDLLSAVEDTLHGRSGW